jgi:hypothetical protein
VPSLLVCDSQHKVAATIQRPLYRGVIGDFADSEYLVIGIHQNNCEKISLGNNL